MSQDHSSQFTNLDVQSHHTESCYRKYSIEQKSYDSYQLFDLYIGSCVLLQKLLRIDYLEDQLTKREV